MQPRKQVKRKIHSFRLTLASNPLQKYILLPLRYLYMPLFACFESVFTDEFQKFNTTQKKKESLQLPSCTNKLQ